MCMYLSKMDFRPLLLVITGYFLLGRSAIETTILRTPGLLYQETEDGAISNLYNLKIINKTHESMPVSLRLKSPKGKIRIVGGPLVVPKNGLYESAFFVDIPAEQIKFSRIPLNIEIFSGEELLEEIKTSFIGPENMK